MIIGALAGWTYDAFLQNGFKVKDNRLVLEGEYAGEQLVVIMNDSCDKVRAVLKRREYEDLVGNLNPIQS